LGSEHCSHHPGGSSTNINKTRAYKPYVPLSTMKQPVAGLERKVVSVPAVYVDDTLIYSGVFSISEAVKTISENKLPSLENFDYRSASEKIMYGFLDSSLIVLYIFIYDDLEKLFRLREFVEAVSRHVFYRYRSDDSYNTLKKQFLEYIGNTRIHLRKVLY
ncbi:MAG: hypothetical protein ACP5GI_07795, partial [Sulfolobales archaeon]